MKNKDTKTKFLRIIWGLGPWLIVILFVIGIGAMFAMISGEKARLEQAKKDAMKKRIPPVRVITLTLSPRLLEDKLDLPAEIEPLEDLRVKAEVSGQIKKILVQEGDAVKAGQVLVRLDDRDYKSRLARIKANLKLAKLDYDRISTLAKKKMTSANKLDEIEARRKDLEAQEDEARLAIDRTRITAPIKGRLNEIEAKLGNLVSVGDEVARILQYDSVKVTVGVPESDVASVFDLDEAEVVIEALDNKRIIGKKIFLSRHPRTLARLYDLELMAPNPDGLILPGMFARVKLKRSAFENAIAIPLYAIISKGDERFVYVEQDGQANKRIVEPGVLIGWQVLIKAGLEPGDRVIIVGHRMVEDGQAIEIIKNVLNPDEVFES